MASIASVQLIVGLEVHVELATRSKMFSRAPNPAAAGGNGEAAEPNTLIDPVVLGLPGALPVMNRAAVEMSMMVGMALGCRIAPVSKWDRKSYFYPDMPKNYQISQYELPLCFDGSVELPAISADGKVDWDAMASESAAAGALPGRRIGIIRAHLEEDAGKLLHEAPGGAAIDFSIVDLNRAGTPLLEIVTQPDFRTADEVVVFAQMLRNTCRFLGATEGVMQKGHMRFEPNINCAITLSDGRLVKTPIVEIKNLNSFKAVKGAIEFELRDQPARWMQDGREMGAGMKTTRGWDDGAGGGGKTVVQREKEDAHDYRYFPDPDLPPVKVSEEWCERVRATIPELPLARARRFIREYGLSPMEAAAIVDERDVCVFYESAIDAAVRRGVMRDRAARLAANFILQSGAKRANERTSAAAGGDEASAGARRTWLISDLGITADQVGALAALRDKELVSAAAADELFGLLCSKEDAPGESPGRGGEEPRGADPEEVAKRRGMLIVRDEGALDAWCEQVIAAESKVADDVRAGKLQAAGRLVGAVMKLSGGRAEAKAVRAKLLEKLGVKE